MNLLERCGGLFQIVTLSPSGDGVGGTILTADAGEAFRAAATRITSPSTGEMAGAPVRLQGGRYRLTGEVSTASCGLGYGCLVRRMEDGAVFRLLSDVCFSPETASLRLWTAEARLVGKMREDGVLEDGLSVLPVADLPGESDDGAEVVS